MSSLPLSLLADDEARAATREPGPARRVRHQAGDSLAVMAISVGLSAGLATVLLVLTSLGR